MCPLCEGRQTVVASLLLISTLNASHVLLFILFFGVAATPFLLADL
jgi:hypothetical protein